MKQQIIGVLAGMTCAVALVAAQTTTQSTQTTQAPTKAADVTVTGCLVQGSGPDSFLLDNARTAMQDRTEKGITYKLVAATEDLSFAQQVNHEVSVTGSADAKVAPAPPAGQKVDENDLPKLNAKALTMVSDRCTAPTR